MGLYMRERGAIFQISVFGVLKGPFSSIWHYESSECPFQIPSPYWEKEVFKRHRSKCSQMQYFVVFGQQDPFGMFNVKRRPTRRPERIHKKISRKIHPGLCSEKFPSDFCRSRFLTILLTLFFHGDKGNCQEYVNRGFGTVVRDHQTSGG